MALVSLESRLSHIKDPEPIESKESKVPKKEKIDWIYTYIQVI